MRVTTPTPRCGQRTHGVVPGVIYDPVFAAHVALMRHHLVRVADPELSFLDLEDYVAQVCAAYRDLFTAAARRVLWIN